MRTIVALLGLVLAACAGSDFDWDQARKIKPGMSEPELVSLMGKPHTVSTQGERQVWVWVYVGAFSGSKSVSAILKDGKVAQAPTIPESYR